MFVTENKHSLVKFLPGFPIFCYSAILLSLHLLINSGTHPGVRSWSKELGAAGFRY